LEDCPLLSNLLASSQNQLNAAFQHQRNDPLTPTYNPRWRNHPNFSWSQGTYQGGTLSNANQPSNVQISRPNVIPYQNQQAFVNTHFTQSFPSQSFVKSIPPLGFDNEQEKKLSTFGKTFMQTATQMLTLITKQTTPLSKLTRL